MHLINLLFIAQRKILPQRYSKERKGGKITEFRPFAYLGVLCGRKKLPCNTETSLLST
jgi:hypothetical protein